MNILRIFSAFFLLSSASAAYAQHPVVLERLESWSEATPAPTEAILTAEVRKAAADIYSADGCTNSALAFEEIEPATADRFAFNAIIRGTMLNAWFVTVRLPECDNSAVRFMVMKNADDSFQTIRVNRGASNAWESLISDTLPLAQTAAAAALLREGVKCEIGSAAKLGATRIASEEADLSAETFGIRYSGSWSEIWPIETCNQNLEVLVVFQADGDGGAYTRLPGDQIRVLP